ncbi:dihydrolipoamide acetyltransferase family protein [Comamonas terrae]|uniref:Dihydrolipoamide acetyltransferase family protein n=1 Tax=Comamonas terrae TaxID=673548 RepID=A0ABW5UPZ0_9BURK|nr:dihydrolipoamide acetyltransferase family protein [Comamonas terrae]
MSTAATTVAAEAGAGIASVPGIPLKGLRGAIARNMAVGWQAPRVAMGVDVDVSACQAWLRTHPMAEGGARPTITACVLRATALALARHPRMNALLKDNVIECQGAVHLGLAVALDEGLMVPVIRDAETKAVAQLAQETRELAAGARAGKLAPKAYQGATFTVTNLGMTGIDWFTPVLNAPQVGILGVSSVRERAVVQDGRLGIAAMTTLTLVFDHRAIDGYPAAQFLQAVKGHLEAPDSL